MAFIVRIIVGLAILWLVVVLMSLVVAWKKGKLVRAIKFLTIAHVLPLVLLVACVWDLSPSVSTPLMSTSDKVTLQQSIRAASRGQTYQLAFNADELERGLRSVADALQLELHSELVFPADDAFDLRFSLKHPLGYLNGSTQGTARIERGAISAQLDRLWIGRLPVPSVVRQWLLDSVLGFVQGKQAAKQAIDAVILGEIREQQARFEVRRERNVAAGLFTRFLPQETSEEVIAAMEVAKTWSRTQAARIQARPGETGFVETTKFVFDEARSNQPTWTAVRQNRVALLAGGVILGHTKLSMLAPQTLSREDIGRIERSTERIAVHQRNDLVRHFWVSAAIATFASSHISNLVGVSKEEMDSGEGGSGFSFADLLADRSGVRFSELATQSENSALEMQTRIQGEWIARDAVASIDGLPEGLPQSAFEKVMGGVRGPGYRKWSNEVDQRVRGSKLLLPTQP